MPGINIFVIRRLLARPSLLLIEPYLKIALPVLGLLDELLPYEPLYAADGSIRHGPIHR